MQLAQATKLGQLLQTVALELEMLELAEAAQRPGVAQCHAARMQLGERPELRELQARNTLATESLVGVDPQRRELGERCEPSVQHRRREMVVV